MPIANLTSPAGDFDLSFASSGTERDDDLIAHARTVLVGDVEAKIADLADVIRSKRAAGRQKDLEVLPCSSATHVSTASISRRGPLAVRDLAVFDPGCSAVPP